MVKKKFDNIMLGNDFYCVNINFLLNIYWIIKEFYRYGIIFLLFLVMFKNYFNFKILIKGVL